MEVRDRPHPNSAEAQALAGLDVQHDLFLSMSDWSQWGAISPLLQDIGGEVESLNLARHANGYSARCRLRRVSAEAARALTARLLDDGLVERASVEHLVLGAKATGATR